MKILIAESIHEKAIQNFISEDFEVIKSSNLEDLKNVDVVCIRSKTKIDSIPKNIRAVACFCIGTDQVNLEDATIKGIPVFHSPFSNTRSVAELVICEVICLSRRLMEKNKEMHSNIWNKSSSSCFEIRGKTLGIIGYGHIGTQLSILAENLGMNVLFYDIVPKLALGNSKSVSLDVLLSSSDFVSIHVPLTEQTENMVNENFLSKMKKNSYLLNLSRGKVVVISDLISFLKSGHLSGCSLDVFPDEPENGRFDCELIGMKNVILTPHIAGSTEEAQELIGIDVSKKIIQYLKHGIIQHAVNFPNIQAEETNKQRIAIIHENKPNVLKKIHLVLNSNISNEILKTNEQIGYVLIDIDEISQEELEKIENIKEVKSVKLISKK